MSEEKIVFQYSGKFYVELANKIIECYHKRIHRVFIDEDGGSCTIKVTKRDG